MTGPKTNEGATVVGEHTGTRARVRYVRASAYKAREVLDLIRGRDVRSADEILQLVERDIAIVIRKGLASAVANAVNNENQIADELYVSACFADEGPTLKRFRPRARGRAFRIRKRSCHITIIVARMDENELDRRRKAEAAKPSTARGRRGAASAAASRRERVVRSRAAADARRAGADGGEAAHDHDHDHDHDAEGHEQDHEPATLVDTVGVEGTESETEHPYGAESHAPLDDGSQPDGFPVKGNADSMLYHAPESPFYGRTKAEVWFTTAEAAEAAGFQLPPSLRDDDAGESDADAEPAGDTDGDD
jgi:large subunit ribosomal protein L22